MELTSKERLWVAGLLLFISLSIFWDLFNDFHSGSSGLHLFIESVIALSALWASHRVLGKYWILKRENIDLKKDITKIKQSETKWKEESARFIQGLSKAIDVQFSHWKLTPSEKEIALLLLKGLSLKEIAQIRGGSEKTVRQHTLMVYQKSGLCGRAELSAFFLEDLLSPFQY